MAVEYCPPSPGFARRKNLQQMIGGRIVDMEMRRDPTCFGTQFRFLVECENGCRIWFGGIEENILTGRISDGYSEEG